MNPKRHLFGKKEDVYYLYFFKGKIQGAKSPAHEKGSELDKSREMYDLNQEVIQEKDK